jgi:TRAP-type C4-dicarboxylate transport system permease small subunit
LRWVDKLVEAFVAIVMAVMVLTVFFSVVFRYVLSSPLGWSEEVCRVTLVWVTFGGSYLAYRRGKHMKMGSVIDKLAPKAKRTVILIGQALTAVFLSILIHQGYLFTMRFLNTRTEGLGISASWYYAILPVGGFLILLATFNHIWTEIKDGVGQSGVSQTTMREE